MWFMLKFEPLDIRESVNVDGGRHDDVPHQKKENNKIKSNDGGRHDDAPHQKKENNKIRK